MRYKLLLVFLFGFTPFVLFSQTIKDVDFSKADSVALNTRYKTDIYDLTRQLTLPFPEKIIKVRAIFRWITDNITYDFKYYTNITTVAKNPKPITVTTIAWIATFAGKCGKRLTLTKS